MLNAVKRRSGNIPSYIRHSLFNNWSVILVILIILIILGPIIGLLIYNTETSSAESDMIAEEASCKLAAQAKADGRSLTGVETETKKYDYAYADSMMQKPEYAAARIYLVQQYFDSQYPEEMLESNVSLYKTRITKAAERTYSIKGYEFPISIIILAILAFFCTQIVFAFDKSKKSSDFFGAMPVRRNEYFAGSALSGMLFTLIPYTISMILTPSILITAGITKYVSYGELWAGFGVFYLYSLFFFILFYALSLLSSVSANSKAVSLFIYLSLNFYFGAFFILGGAISGMDNGQFADFVNNSKGLHDFIFHSSPFFKFIEFAQKGTHLGALEIIIYLAAAAAIIFLAMLIFKHKRADNVSLPSPFMKLRYPLQHILMVIATIACAAFFYAIGNGKLVWLFVGIGIGCVLSYIALNSIFEGSIKAAFKNIKHLVLLAVITGLIACFVFIDFFGFFRLPDISAENADSLKIVFGTDGMYSYNGITGNDAFSSIELDSSSELAEKSDAIKLITAINKANQSGKQLPSYNYMPFISNAYTELAFKWKLESNTYYSFISLVTAEDKTAGDALYGLIKKGCYAPGIIKLLESKKNAYAAAFSVYEAANDYSLTSVPDITEKIGDADILNYIEKQSIFNGTAQDYSDKVKIDGDKLNKLVEALKKDYADASLEELSGSSGYYVSVIFNSDGTGIFANYPAGTQISIPYAIPAEFGNTVAFLKSEGVGGNDSAEYTSLVNSVKHVYKLNNDMSAPSPTEEIEVTDINAFMNDKDIVPIEYGILDFYNPDGDVYVLYAEKEDGYSLVYVKEQ
ncbi:MAG: ABC transporter permease subunit [Oscillospiraceae bacterium]|nr:ABC transporter permease subunit [Oscillospiraceae bacterium]